ncbi:hypothetical protein STURON_00589 [Spiroplasma turonicum]|uniref:Uncharacterized protein n=1 Tax=Spiroplasma turonicum TaxID=216946 RepID=A0A0K1P6C8_9MOLU|nr:hypothetical protein STURON_00589 [Spiroplasma turonicum]ALX70851.1 hypothetical protein STURO_v1c05850 [Spiroplasma turonicum]
MEIKWTKIKENTDSIVYSSEYFKLRILAIFLKESNSFEGCYIVNLKNINDNISKYHFYTTNYILFDNLWKMCIKPLNSIIDIKNETNLEEININIEKWFKNNLIIFKYNLDFLGQCHNSNIVEFYRSVQNGDDAMEAWTTSIKYKDNDFENFQKKYKLILNIINTIKYLMDIEIYNFIKNSKVYEVDTFFKID